MDVIEKPFCLDPKAPHRTISVELLARRDFLRHASILALAGTNSVTAGNRVKPDISCRPVVSGILWWVSPQQNTEWGEAGWERELEEQKQLGFDLLWLTNSPSILDNPACALRTLLDFAASTISK